MDNVHCIGVGELTEEQIHFLVGSGANDMLREELASVDDVVSDEIVDTVLSRESNHATSDQIDHTTAKYQEEKILVPVPRFTVVGKSVHFALQWSGDEVDRLTSSFNKKGLMSREDYNDLSTTKI